MTQMFLAATRPCLYDRDKHGGIVPTAPPATVGAGVDVEFLMNANIGGSEELRTGLLDTMQTWLNKFLGELSTQVARVQQLCLILDSRNRTVAGLERTP